MNRDNMKRATFRRALGNSVLALLGAGLVIGCGGSSPPPSDVPATKQDAPPSATAADPSEKFRADRVAAHEAEMQQDQSEHPTLALGSPAPDFSLQGVDGKVHTLKEYAGSPILAVVFISNHCPASQLYEGRIKAIVADYAKKGVQVVAIAPNGPAAIGPSALNFTDVDDSFKGMQIRAAHRQFTFPYLYDGETQSVSHRYGPQVTPHLFIFDKDRKLRYEGRIDDRMQEEKVASRDARTALDAMVANQPVAVGHTPVFGCSTKWNTHSEAAKAEMTAWLNQPVALNPVSLVELTELRKNKTGKTLMVNFWATWCAPCQIEYPALLETYLWYQSRDFEFVSVSVDAPEQKATVEKFLQKTHSSIRNLQVDTDDVYKVMASFDPAWQAGVPFTMVIGPDGSVIFRRSGEVDLLKLRRAILGHLPDAGFFAGNSAYWRD